MAFCEPVDNKRPLISYFGFFICVSLGSALHVTNDPDYAKPCVGKKSLLEIGYPPHRGQETGYDLREEFKNMKPSLARDVIELASPQQNESHLWREAETFNGTVDSTTNPEATCTVIRFREYALCKELMNTMAPQGNKWTALSFGGNGYDDWSEQVKSKFDVVPEVFDCYDPRPIHGTIMHDICVGGQAERTLKSKEGRKWQDLNEILKKEKPRSVLMKLDIEHSEFGVLRELSDDSFGKIASLTVEYHFFPPRCCGFQEVKELFQKLAKKFIVLDGEALRWGDHWQDCRINGGYQWPPALSVSYIARDVVQKR